MSEHGEEGKILDLEHLHMVCGDDSAFEREIIGDYLGQAEPNVARLAAAVATRDPVELKFVAHALTGSSRSLGGAAFGDACAELEGIAQRGEIARAPSALARALAEWERLREALCAHRDRPAA